VAGRGVNLLVFDGFDASRRECVLEAGDEGTSTARVAAGLALRRAASLTGTGGAGAGAGREATAGPTFGPLIGVVMKGWSVSPPDKADTSASRAFDQRASGNTTNAANPAGCKRSILGLFVPREVS